VIEGVTKKNPGKNFTFAAAFHKTNLQPAEKFQKELMYFFRGCSLTFCISSMLDIHILTGYPIVEQTDMNIETQRKTKY
jgi:hypothetical protein